MKKIFFTLIHILLGIILIINIIIVFITKEDFVNTINSTFNSNVLPLSSFIFNIIFCSYFAYIINNKMTNKQKKNDIILNIISELLKSISELIEPFKKILGNENEEERKHILTLLKNCDIYIKILTEQIPNSNKIEIIKQKLENIQQIASTVNDESLNNREWVSLEKTIEELKKELILLQFDFLS